MNASPSSRTSSRLPSAALAAASTAWLLLIACSPYLVVRQPAGSLLWRAGGLAYVAGHAVCHQRSDRSFHAWGVQLPVCGRCVGLYGGAALGALWAATAGRRRTSENARRALPPDWRTRLAIAAAPTAASVGLEFAGVWGQTPGVRALAAIPLGFVVAWFVGTHASEVFERVRSSV
jgi:hypothetical protein